MKHWKTGGLIRNENDRFFQYQGIAENREILRCIVGQESGRGVFAKGTLGRHLRAGDVYKDVWDSMATWKGKAKTD